jgi:hypothetical protein
VKQLIQEDLKNKNYRSDHSQSCLWTKIRLEPEKRTPGTKQLSLFLFNIKRKDKSPIKREAEPNKEKGQF